VKSESNSSARILDAALTLFAERGYEATSTREICEQAGITKPTLYYFYKSKEGIFRALIRNAMSDFSALVAEGLTSNGCLRERVKRVAHLCFQDANRRPRLWRLIFATAYSVDSPFSADANDSYRDIARQVAAAIAAASRAGELRPGDIKVRVLVLMGAFAETVSNSLILGAPRLTRKLADGIVDTVFDGWRPAKPKA
jgi:AcrR family transcriptional regulator